MLRDIKVTLYDIFGYLLPGIILLVAIAIIFWVFICSPTIEVPNKLTLEQWLLVLLLSYIFGHMSQAIANLLFKFLPSNESLVLSKDQKNNLPESLILATKSKVSAILGIDLEKITDEMLYTFCDETTLQGGNITDREVLQYRKGFYRGLSVSFLILFIAFVLRVAVPGASISISYCIQSLNWRVFLFSISISLACCLLFFFRYLRFARHRVVRAIMGFTVLRNKINP